MAKNERATENESLSFIPKDRLRFGVALLVVSASFLTGIFLKIKDVNVLGGAAFLAGLIAMAGINLIASANPRT